MSSTIAAYITSSLGCHSRATVQRKKLLRELHDLTMTPRGKEEVDVLLGRNQEFRFCTVAFLPSAVFNQLDIVEVQYDSDELNETHCKQLDELILNRTSYKDFLKGNSCGDFRMEWFGKRKEERTAAFKR